MSDARNYKKTADGNNTNTGLFNDSVSPNQFLGNARQLQADIATAFDNVDGNQHVLIKSGTYTVEHGQVLYIHATTNIQINYPTNPTNGFTFVVKFYDKDSDSFTVKVDTTDITNKFGNELLYEYADGAWSESPIQTIKRTAPQWKQLIESEGFKNPGDTNLGELGDVSTTGITDGQTIIYDDTSKAFKPGASGGNVDLSGYTKLDGSGTFTNISTWKSKLGIPSLTGYATQNWVNSQGFLKNIPSTYALKSDIPSLSGYATQNWVNSQNFLKSVPSTYALKSDLTTYRTIATSYSKSEVDTKIAGIDAGTGWATIINDDKTLTNEKLYWLYLTTSSTGTYNLTLPSSPSNNDTLYVILNEKNGSGKFKIKGQINNTTDYEIKNNDFKKLLKLEYFSGSNWQLTVVMDWTKTAPVDISDLAKKNASNANVSDWQTKLKIPADTTTALSGKLNNPASGHHNVTVDSSWDLKGNSQTLTGSGTGDIPRTDAELVLKAQRALLTDSSGNNKRFVMQNGNNWISVRYDANGVMQTNVIGTKDSLVTVDTKSSGAKITDFYVNSTKVELMSKADITTELAKYTLTKDLPAQPNLSPYAKLDGSANTLTKTADWRTKLSVFSKDETRQTISSTLSHKSSIVQFGVSDLQQADGAVRLQPFIVVPETNSFKVDNINKNTDEKISLADTAHARGNGNKEVTFQYGIFVPRGWTIDETGSGDNAKPKNTKGTSYYGQDLDGIKITDKNSVDHLFRIKQAGYGKVDAITFDSFSLEKDYSHDGTTYSKAVIINVKATQTVLAGKHTPRIGMELWVSNAKTSRADSLPMYLYAIPGHHDVNKDFITTRSFKASEVEAAIALKADSADVYDKKASNNRYALKSSIPSLTGYKKPGDIEIYDLKDFSSTAATSGQVLTYDGSEYKFKTPLAPIVPIYNGQQVLDSPATATLTIDESYLFIKSASSTNQTSAITLSDGDENTDTISFEIGYWHDGKGDLSFTGKIGSTTSQTITFTKAQASGKKWVFAWDDTNKYWNVRGGQTGIEQLAFPKPTTGIIPGSIDKSWLPSGSKLTSKYVAPKEFFWQRARDASGPTSDSRVKCNWFNPTQDSAKTNTLNVTFDEIGKLKDVPAGRYKLVIDMDYISIDGIQIFVKNGSTDLEPLTANRSANDTNNSTTKLHLEYEFVNTAKQTLEFDYFCDDPQRINSRRGQLSSKPGYDGKMPWVTIRLQEVLDNVYEGGGSSGGGVSDPDKAIFSIQLGEDNINTFAANTWQQSAILGGDGVSSLTESGGTIYKGTSITKKDDNTLYLEKGTYSIYTVGRYVSRGGASDFHICMKITNSDIMTASSWLWEYSTSSIPANMAPLALNINDDSSRMEIPQIITVTSKAELTLWQNLDVYRDKYLGSMHIIKIG